MATTPHRSPSAAVSLLALVSIVAIVGMIPLALDRDSFPLSTYPMFSSRRSSTESVDTAVVVTADGSTTSLSPPEIAGTDEVILAAVTVSEAISSGTAAALCDEIAARVSADRSGDDGADAPSAVEVVTLRYDAIDWYAGRREPIDRTVHASCPVAAP